MEKVKLNPHTDKLSFTSWNPKDTLRQINGHGQDLQKLQEAINWLIDQVLAMKTPASTSVNAETNQTKAINKAPAVTKDT
jgi:hypothetical protein